MTPTKELTRHTTTGEHGAADERRGSKDYYTVQIRDPRREKPARREVAGG